MNMQPSLHIPLLKSTHTPSTQHAHLLLMMRIRWACWVLGVCVNVKFSRSFPLIVMILSLVIILIIHTLERVDHRLFHKWQYFHFETWLHIRSLAYQIILISDHSHIRSFQYYTWLHIIRNMIAYQIIWISYHSNTKHYTHTQQYRHYQQLGARRQPPCLNVTIFSSLHMKRDDILAIHTTRGIPKGIVTRTHHSRHTQGYRHRYTPLKAYPRVSSFSAALCALATAVFKRARSC